MKFKLDENLGARTADLFARAGHDVQTVSQERLNGVDDNRLFATCASEGRCLITLDLDFAEILRFPPSKGAGIAILRVPRAASLNLLTELVQNLLSGIERESITGRLWIVEVGRIRIHEEAGE